ncbi:hypothetical protein [Nannocystis pusilla]|uniref:Uncharacterized protein n=1 Tax=Nannocystis pusilla TaxID=889268 RepID=A0ABS7TM66_9BACT|nr:hypothetical protein [Nannocystis pusilla]MBZ5709171.1 hypothetical protein [Nannocystis pusilla]
MPLALLQKADLGGHGEATAAPGPTRATARHEDCDPGLVCGAHRGEGYGICQCPGLVRKDVAPPQRCFRQ